MPVDPEHSILFNPGYVSREIKVGDLTLGGNNPVRIQSMTNTSTSNIPATVSQITQLVNAGCDIVRLAVQNRKEVENLYIIKNKLKRSGIRIPLVADVHFNPGIAEIAARYVEKVRINPGNYIERHLVKINLNGKGETWYQEKIAEQLRPLIMLCKQEGTAIRIGVNHGSLSERILIKYGNTPEGMVESAMEFIRICYDENFANLTLSLKASHVPTMIKANRMLIEKMMTEGFDYPLHLGVTEAGNGEEARTRSIAGIGSLLASGIGDTVRVSLTEDPVNEIPVAKELIKHYGRNKNAKGEIIRHADVYQIETEKSLKTITGQKFPVITTGFSQHAELYFNRGQGNILRHENLHLNIHTIKQFPVPNNSIIKLSYPSISSRELRIRATVDFTLLAGCNTSAGIWIENGENAETDELTSLSLKILQALGKRFTQAVFVACPSCGRSQFNVIEKLKEVKAVTSHLKGLKIAVMGCVVNGIGEMGDADYGFVGAAPGKVILYHGGYPVMKNIPESKAVEKLINLITKNGDWKEINR